MEGAEGRTEAEALERLKLAVAVARSGQSMECQENRVRRNENPAPTLKRGTMRSGGHESPSQNKPRPRRISAPMGTRTILAAIHSTSRHRIIRDGHVCGLSDTPLQAVITA